MTSSTAGLPLLLEVGCEEIPARFLAQAQQDLGERLRSGLIEARLLDDQPVGAVREPPLQTYSTPRRLVAHVVAILERQPDVTEEVVGPPVKVAFDKDGKPTRAAESFAAKNGCPAEDLYRVTAPKGEYLAVKKTTSGRPAIEVLGEVLPGVVTSLGFPKSMYWEGSKLRWVRPIRWMVALLGEGESAQVIPFELAGVESGNATRGHRAFEPGPITVTGFDDYACKLRERSVEFDPGLRRARVEEEVKVVLDGSALRVLEDKGLEDWIVNSTEWPRALLGSFEERFLKLPREILITVMRDHQKYFGVEDGQGSLQPRFVTVLNQQADSHGLVKKGHERVLAARFADAEFFWNADQKVPLRDRLPMLERVTYQAKLGSYADKVRRMEAIAPQVYGQFQVQGKLTKPQCQAVLRALRLCKCDLTTQMVQEFTELQGIVGGRYAEAQGESEAVWQAIYDHYRPAGMEDELPRSLEGVVVSLVDKVDSLAAGFAAGLEPTGSSDPFGLRRLGNGVVRLLAEGDLELNLESLVESAAGSVPKPSGMTHSQVTRAALNFLRERLRYYLETRDGFPADVVRAALAAEWNYFVPRVRTRAQGLAQAMGSDDFIQVCAAAKRVRNILAQAREKGFQPSGVRLDRLVDDAERKLFDESRAVKGRVSELDALRKYHEAFQAMATLRRLVDVFFEKVMVMVDDPALRGNRLAILEHLQGLFSSIADLSQIESKTLSNVDAPTSGAAGGHSQI